MIIKENIRIEQDFEFKLDLEPEQFKDCDTVNQLKYEIGRKFDETNRTNGRTIDKKFFIPDEFIKEWKYIVGFIPNNVMTYRRKEKLITDSDVYIKTYSGNELHYMSTIWRWDTFDLRDYRDFPFDEKKNYKCYLIDTDNWDSTTTSLLFAEEAINF